MWDYEDLEEKVDSAIGAKMPEGLEFVDGTQLNVQDDAQDRETRSVLHALVFLFRLFFLCLR